MRAITQAQATALGDLIYYATLNADFDEDVAMYESIAKLLDDLVDSRILYIEKETADDDDE